MNRLQKNLRKQHQKKPRHRSLMLYSQNNRRSFRSLKRFILYMTALTIVCFLLVYLVFLSGIIESQVVPFVSDRILGARLNLHIDSLWPLRIRDIQLQQGATTPLLKTEGVTVSFKQAPSSFLPVIESVDILHPQLHIDAKEQTQSNYAFLRPFFNNQGSEDGSHESNPSRWLPQRVTVDAIDMKVDMPEWSATISNINLATEIEGARQMSAHVSGDTVLAGWQSGYDWLDIPLPQGMVDTTIAMVQDNIDVKANILLPDFITLDGNAAMTFQPGLHVDIMLNTLQVNAPVFGELISRFSPLPVGYDTVRIAPFQLSMSLEDRIPVIKNAECNIQAQNLLLGMPDAPWYAGDIGIVLQGEYGAGSRAAWTATLNQGQQISGAISTEDAGIKTKTIIKNWTRDDISALWPKPYIAWEVWLPDLKHNNSTTNVYHKDNTINFDTNVSTTLPSGTNTVLTGSGNYDRSSNSLFFQGKGTLGNGTCVFEGSKDPLFSTNLFVDAIDASDIVSCLPWKAVRPIRGDVTGKATLALEDNGNYVFQINADATSPTYDTWALPETLGAIGLDCDGSLKANFSTIKGKGTIDLVDNAKVNLTSFLYDIGSSQVTTDFDGIVTLTPLAAALGFDDLWGDLALAGTLNLANWQHLSLSPLQITSESLGYGDYSLPYGDKLHIESPVKLDMTNLSISAGPSLITLGEGTKITSDIVQISADHTVDASSMSLESDFSLLVARQFLDHAEGKINVALEGFQYGNNTINGNIVYECTADHLVLPEKLADIRGLTAVGTALLPPNPESKGQLQIEDLLIGGSKLQNTRGDIFLVEQGLVFEDVNFELFGGGVVARASVNILGPEFSIDVSGKVQNLDLSVFTSEFEPPSLMLTGRVNGTFHVVFTTQQLHALDVDLIASDDFSMNRDMVEQLLMSQYVNEMTGGRQMTRVLQSVIGKDEQRKFDGARLVLGLENERIAGYAKLESEKLNLTVDIKADPPALIEALKTRQQ